MHIVQKVLEFFPLAWCFKVVVKNPFPLSQSDINSVISMKILRLNDSLLLLCSWTGDGHIPAEFAENNLGKKFINDENNERNDENDPTDAEKTWRDGVEEPLTIRADLRINKLYIMNDVGVTKGAPKVVETLLTKYRVECLRAKLVSENPPWHSY